MILLLATTKTRTSLNIRAYVIISLLFGKSKLVTCKTFIVEVAYVAEQAFMSISRS